MTNNFLQVLIFTGLLAFSIAASGQTTEKVSDAFWLPDEVNTPGVLEQFQRVVSAEGQAINSLQNTPVKIALIYPSNDVSDFWWRNYSALTKRLDELNISHSVDEFSSRQVEHSLQTTYTNQVLKNARAYDFVIFGPSALITQAPNIERLAASDDFHTFVWAFHTPVKTWRHIPKMWFDFSSSVGAKVVCEYLLERIGKGVLFAMNRGIPGVTDNQRSGEFKDCVESQGEWEMVYEHYGQYQESGGRDGVKLISDFFPEVQVLHNANTAMSVGVVDYLSEVEKTGSMITTGWGGTDKELALVIDGKLSATPMRMGDDVGVATAEAIKFILAGRDDLLPMVYLGRITIANDQMSKEEIINLKNEAFRYSNQGDARK